tara:strand:+ start:37233 stop:38531 length:1299 start_codon:yes stop_codon:yes gene_type:complete
MAALTGASVYEKFNITSKDGKKTVSIIGGVLDFQYFENLYSPITTAIIEVANTGNTIDGQGIYNGLPIRGGERVHFQIKTPFDNLSGKAEPFDYIMYVDKILSYASDKRAEHFVLHLVSREGITNEQTRISRKYSDPTIDKSIQQILSLVEPLQAVDLEKTENAFPFTGNMKHPLTWAVLLSKHAVPVGAKSKSAGFFFWQTKRGFVFKSIDGLVKFAKEKEKEAQKYYYRETMSNPYENPGENATTILTFQVNKSADLRRSLNEGEKSSYRIFFNPLDFSFTQPNESLFTPDFKNILGELEEPAAVADPENINATQWAPRVLSGTANVGTLDVGVSTEFNYNPYQDQAQAAARYSSFSNIDLTILVPVNTNLCAGDPVNLEFPKVSVETPEIDRKTSGLYIIREITHKFLPTKSYTSMRVVKDSPGNNTKS